MTAAFGLIIGCAGVTLAIAVIFLWLRDRGAHATAIRHLTTHRDALEQRVSHSTQDLARTQARFETALRGSRVSVFSQDRDLRYTYVSGTMFGLKFEEIVGRLDGEILPAESISGIAALKADVLETGRVVQREVGIREGAGIRWYEYHVEPLKDHAGVITGITCAAIDITERRAADIHLRLLMRELTHRSKNLLAVIQAMAWQTAKHSGSIDSFLEHFNARLQAVATSHDLLVQESWHGVSLAALSSHQLADFKSAGQDRVLIDGPQIHLRPEAAQSLGLALHELAVNAERFGALSVPAGRVALTWRRLNEGQGIEINWIESAGPHVEQPSRRGFGSLVVEKNLARSLDARVDLDFAWAGVQCRVVIPENHLFSGPH